MFNHYRHKSEMSDPDGLTALFSQTPFINGGLFDCLDSEAATGNGGYRIDCFTDNPSHRRGFSIPNRLFFSQSPESLGLIPLFEKYKFTVEENTPVEQEGGRWTLNCWARSSRTCWRRTTPKRARRRASRPAPTTRRAQWWITWWTRRWWRRCPKRRCRMARSPTRWKNRLRAMLDYSYPFEEIGVGFDAGESRAIVEAVAGLRALDPAVGSGAFPMGILHKLTLALRRVDPENAAWQNVQKQAAMKTDRPWLWTRRLNRNATRRYRT